MWYSGVMVSTGLTGTEDDMSKRKRNSKTAQRASVVDNGKPLGTSRGVMPKPTRTMRDRKAESNKRACRDWRG